MDYPNNLLTTTRDDWHGVKSGCVRVLTILRSIQVWTRVLRISPGTKREWRSNAHAHCRHHQPDVTTRTSWFLFHVCSKSWRYPRIFCGCHETFVSRYETLRIFLWIVMKLWKICRCRETFENLLQMSWNFWESFADVTKKIWNHCWCHETFKNFCLFRCHVRESFASVTILPLVSSFCVKRSMDQPDPSTI
jgi:hypothetical protein